MAEAPARRKGLEDEMCEAGELVAGHSLVDPSQAARSGSSRDR
jgi:hypothetical protein